LSYFRSPPCSWIGQSTTEKTEQTSPFMYVLKVQQNAPSTTFPVNPISFIDSINNTNKRLGIDKFVDIICKYSNIGIKQRGTLREAVSEAFTTKKLGEHPSLPEINELLLEIVGDKRDTLTEIIDELSRYNIFKDDKNVKSFLSQNIYLSLSGYLSNSVRFTSLFLIINYIYNVFMNMENTPTDNGCRAMRYVLLIDEAHVIFKEKKYQELLEKNFVKSAQKPFLLYFYHKGLKNLIKQLLTFQVCVRFHFC